MWDPCESEGLCWTMTMQGSSSAFGKKRALRQKNLQKVTRKIVKSQNLDDPQERIASRCGQVLVVNESLVTLKFIIK